MNALPLSIGSAMDRAIAELLAPAGVSWLRGEEFAGSDDRNRHPGAAGPIMINVIELGQRVRVHVNLHRRRLSVLNPRTGRVITYVDDITLTEVEFRHQPACVRRVQEHGVRRVGAYAMRFVDAVNTHPPGAGRRVKTNPFLRPETVTRVDRVVFTNLRAYAVTSPTTPSPV